MELDGSSRKGGRGMMFAFLISLFAITNRKPRKSDVEREWW